MSKKKPFTLSIASVKGKRPQMEDAHLIMEDLFGLSTQIMVGVFDGHSGLLCSTYIADNLGALIEQRVQGITEGEAILGVLEECFGILDEAWLVYAGEALPPIDDGSTGLVLLVLEGFLYFANVGDCRGVIADGGIAITVTVDHKPEVEEERNRIEASGGLVLNGRVQGSLSVSRAFGDRPFKDKKCITCSPDTFVYPISMTYEFIILACDGLWDMMSNQEAVDFVQSCINKGDDVIDIADKLVQEALELGSTDNVTIIILFLSKKLRKESAAKIKKKSKKNKKYTNSSDDTATHKGLSQSAEIKINQPEWAKSSDLLSTGKNKTRPKRLSKSTFKDKNTISEENLHEKLSSSVYQHKSKSRKKGKEGYLEGTPQITSRSVSPFSSTKKHRKKKISDDTEHKIPRAKSTRIDKYSIQREFKNPELPKKRSVKSRRKRSISLDNVELKEQLANIKDAAIKVTRTEHLDSSDTNPSSFYQNT